MSLMSLYLQYESLSLTDVERELRLSKTAAFRLAATLEEQKYLIKDKRTKRFFLGPVIFQLVRKHQKEDLIGLVQDLIQELVTESGETANISIRTGEGYSHISVTEGAHLMKVSWSNTASLSYKHLHAGSAGKLLLAYMSPSEQEDYLKNNKLKAFTDKTITKRDEMIKEITRIREQGYSTSIEEAELGIAGISAPIWGISREPLAALSIFLPVTRLIPNKEQELTELVKKYAQKMSDKVNGSWN